MAMIVDIKSNTNKEEEAQSVVEVKTEEEVKAEEEKAEKTEMDLRNENFGLKYADKKFLYEVMSIPTLSSYEYRMVLYIILWAKKRGIEYKLDSYGNLYLTKGELSEGEYYPCVTAHLDTVQDKHKAFIMAGAELDIRTRINKENKHELYVDNIGIGADDKGAIFIGLSMMEKIDVIKGAFFLEEEVGMKGSDKMDKTFFDDVGYVIGFDSPDFNRSAWKCSGTKLFTGEFYRKHMKPVCDKYGYTKFYSEPYTDIKNIVEETKITCMNFCNGGYKAHDTSAEYIVAEETDNALGMGLELVETIGRTRHLLPSTSWVRNESGALVKEYDETEDNNFLKSLGDDNRYNYSYAYSSSSSSNSQKGSSSGSTSGSTSSHASSTSEAYRGESENVDIETIKYIVATYDEAIENIKDGVKDVCKTLGLDFEKTFAKVFKSEIKF